MIVILTLIRVGLICFRQYGFCLDASTKTRRTFACTLVQSPNAQVFGSMTTESWPNWVQLQTNRSLPFVCLRVCALEALAKDWYRKHANDLVALRNYCPSACGRIFQPAGDTSCNGNELYAYLCRLITLTSTFGALSLLLGALKSPTQKQMLLRCVRARAHSDRHCDWGAPSDLEKPVRACLSCMLRNLQEVKGATQLEVRTEIARRSFKEWASQQHYRLKFGRLF